MPQSCWTPQLSHCFCSNTKMRLFLVVGLLVTAYVTSSDSHEDFAQQQHQEAMTHFQNQKYNPLSYSASESENEDDEEESRVRRSPTGKFLIIKGEIRDDSDEDETLSILEKLFPSKERIIVHHPPLPPPAFLNPPPFLGPTFPAPFQPGYQPNPPPQFFPPPFPDVSSVMVYPPEAQNFVSPPFMAPPPMDPKYFIDDTMSEGNFRPDTMDRFKGISQGGDFSMKPKNGDSQKVQIGYIPAGKSQKDKGRFHPKMHNSQHMMDHHKMMDNMKMMDFVPEPEPAGCHCPNGGQGRHIFFQSWPSRSKRCVKRCAYHDMLKKMKQEKADKNSM